MSFLVTLSEDHLDEIIPLLDKYEKKISAAEGIFKLDGRRIEEIEKTIAHHQSSYDLTLQEVKALEDWINNIKEKRVGKLWKKYTEGYSRALSTRDIQAYIASEKDIVELNQVLIEVTLLKNSLNAIVEAIKQLGWRTADIVKLRVSEMEESLL